MQQSLFKLVALAVVVGIGVLVVVQAQRGMTISSLDEANAPHASENPEDEQADAQGEGDDDGQLAEQSEPDDDDASPAVPAAEKTGRAARNPSRAGQLLNDDPFSLNETEGTADVEETPPARSSAGRATSRAEQDELEMPGENATRVADDASDPFAEEPLAGRTGRGAARRTGHDTATGAVSERRTRPSSGAGTGPRLMGGDTAGPPRLRPVGGDDADDADPLAENEADSLPATLPDEKPASDEARTEVADEDSTAADEMPLIERAAPRRKATAPAAPALLDADDPEDKETITRPATAGETVPAAPADEDTEDAFGKDEPESPRSKDNSVPRSPPERLKNDAPAGGFELPPDDEMIETDSRKADDALPDAADFGSGRSTPERDAPSLPDDAGETVPAPAERNRTTGSQPRTGGSAAGRGPRARLTIDKVAPPSAVLGQPMVYHIVVRNVGQAPANGVVVEDAVPRGVKIDGSIPQARLVRNRLVWKLGTIEADAERKIAVRVIPESEGTMGSVATVNFDAEPARASAKLKFDISAPRRATLGSPVAFNYRVSNTGTVDASGVVIRNVLPAGLRHPDGDDLEYEIGALAAGQTREVELTLTAAQAGRTINRVVVTADGNIAEESVVTLDVHSPALEVARSGPKRVFPGKAARFTNTVTNPGQTAVSGVSVVETVPAGFEFVEATDGGQYNAARRSVSWTIERLAPGEARRLLVTLSAQARGAQVSVVRTYDSAGATGETMGTTHISGVPALSIEISDLPPLIEPEETIAVSVRLHNRGSDAATGVRTMIALPAGMELISAKGPGGHKVSNDAIPARDASRSFKAHKQLQFDPIPRIDARDSVTIELSLRARANGTARIEVAAQCDEIAEPVRREELATVAASPE